MSPIPMINRIVNYDYLSSAVPRTFFHSLLLSQQAVMSAPFEANAILGVNIERFQDSMVFSLVMEPVWSESNEARRSVAGVVVAIFPWDAIFDGALQDGQEGLVVVAESCGANMTFLLDGSTVSTLPPGDHHDPKYDQYVSQTVLLTDNNGGLNGNVCKHKLFIFPSDKMLSSASPIVTATDNAAILCGIIVVVLVFGTLLFSFYDHSLRNRCSRIPSQSIEAKALVQQMMIPAHMNPQLVDLDGDAENSADPGKVKTLDTSNQEDSD